MANLNPVCKAPPAPAAHSSLSCLYSGLQNWSFQLLRSYLGFGFCLLLRSITERVHNATLQTVLLIELQVLQRGAAQSGADGGDRLAAVTTGAGESCRTAECSLRCVEQSSPVNLVHRDEPDASCAARSEVLQHSSECSEWHCPHCTKWLQHLHRWKSCGGRERSLPNVPEPWVLHQLDWGGWEEESSSEKPGNEDRPWHDRAMQMGRDLRRSLVLHLLKAGPIRSGC